MSMLVTLDDVHDFLTADGYKVAAGTGPHRISAARVIGADREQLEIWLPTIAEPRQPTADLVKALQSARLAAPGTTRMVLLPTMTHLGTEFLGAATGAAAFVRTFGFFFDAPYRQGGPSGQGLGGGKQGRDAAQFFRSRELYRPELLIGAVDVGADDKPTATAEWRVPQPFRIQRSISPENLSPPSHEDLLHRLVADARQQDGGVQVTLVIGPAGIGKSILFSALFTWWYDQFQRAKLEQKVATRPIAVLPQDVGSVAAYKTGDLLEAVAKTAGAKLLRPELLDWSLRSGRCALLCDGLDEFFAEQTDFLAEIDRRHLTGGRAQFYIFLRDSLLVSSPSLQSLVSQLQSRSGLTTRIYRLVKWNEMSGVGSAPSDPRRTMVWLRREGHGPTRADEETSKTGPLLDRMRQNPVAWDLAALPLFCELLIEKLSASEAGASVDEYELLEYLLERLADREWGKHAPFSGAYGSPPEDAFISRSRWAELTSWAQSSGWDLPLQVFSKWRARRSLDASAANADIRGALSEFRRKHGTAGLYELLEQFAFGHRCGTTRKERTAAGSATTNLAARHRQHMPDLDEANRARGERILKQFALFTQGSASTIDFAHPIIADYLAARYVVRELKRSVSEVCVLLNHTAPEDSDVFYGHIKREVARDPALASKLTTRLSDRRLANECKARLQKVLST